MADPSIRLSNSATQTTAGANISVGITGTPANGELILFIVSWNETPSFSTPAVTGFSTIASITSADWNPLYILGKIASGEGTNPTYTCSFTGGSKDGGSSAVVLVFQDANSSLPTNTASTHDTTASTSYSIPALTTAKAGSFDLVAVTPDGNNDTGPPNFSAWGTSLAELFDISPSPNSYAQLGVAGVTRASAGSQSATTVTGASNDKNVALRIEVEPPAAGGTTVTPGVASLSLSTFAPKANLQINGASPTALSLSAFAPQANLRINGASPTALALSAFAPQANLRINGASPTALSLSTFAPTAGLGPLTCTPGVLALALSTFAPTVSTSGNQTATPGVLSLALATFAPQLQLTLTPSLVALTLATFAPSLGLTIPVGLVTLALSTFAPPLEFRVTPGPGALVTATFAPTIVTPQTVTPGVAALVLTRYAPVITGPAAAAAPGYAFLSDEPTARASVFDSRMAIATLSDAVVGRAEVMDGGA